LEYRDMQVSTQQHTSRAYLVLSCLLSTCNNLVSKNIRSRGKKKRFGL
jgi:hypothetical protein